MAGRLERDANDGEPRGAFGGDAGEVARLGFKLGCTAFGGPAVHVAMLRDEAVVRRCWLTDSRFTDLLGMTNLLPGPNSTEMVMHIGFKRAGWRGLLAAGVGFITPAAIVSLAFAWGYVRFGATPSGTGFLNGVQPVAIAVIGWAVWSLGKSTVHGVAGLLLTGCVALLHVLGVHELILLVFGALTWAGWPAFRRMARDRGGTALGIILPWLLVPFGVPLALAPRGEEPTALRLFLVFLKIGATLYGSGYVLVAYLRSDLVERTSWLTEQQLLDAIAIGQITPGPLLSAATFAGYLAGGWTGAIAATVGIFLPAFLLVGFASSLLPRLRRISWVAPIVDGLGLAAIGLMAAVLVPLGRAALTDNWRLALAVLAFLLLVRFRVNAAILIAGGGLLGLLVTALA